MCAMDPCLTPLGSPKSRALSHHKALQKINPIGHSIVVQNLLLPDCDEIWTKIVRVMEVQTQITKCFAKCTISVQIQPNSVRRWFSLKGRDPEIFSQIHLKMTILEPFEACVVSSVKSSYLMGGCVNARTTNFRTGEKKGRGSKQTLIFNQLLEEKVLTFLTPIVKKGPL